MAYYSTVQDQLPALPVSKHHQIMTVALSQPWPDVALDQASTGAQQPSGATLRRHSLMPATPAKGRITTAEVRRASADVSVDVRERKGSCAPLPTSYTAHQATAIKQQFENLLDTSGNPLQPLARDSLFHLTQNRLEGIPESTSLSNKSNQLDVDPIGPHGMM